MCPTEQDFRKPHCRDTTHAGHRLLLETPATGGSPVHVKRRGGRVVYCAGLENRRAERLRGFESHPLRTLQSRQKSNPGMRTKFDCQRDSASDNARSAIIAEHAIGMIIPPPPIPRSRQKPNRGMRTRFDCLARLPASLALRVSRVSGSYPGRNPVATCCQRDRASYNVRNATFAEPVTGGIIPPGSA